jgi:hypothetical protein
LEQDEVIKPLKALSETPLKIYKESLSDIASVLQTHSDAVKSKEPNYFKYLPETHPLILSVKEWATTYHLDVEWCREAAFSTLLDWRTFPALLKRPLGFSDVPYACKYFRYNSLGDDFSATDREKEFLSYYWYKFEIERREKYLQTTEELIEQAIEKLRREALGYPVLYLMSEEDIANLKQSLKSKVKSLCDKIENAAKRKGYKTPDKRSANTRHLIWLARYQVFGWRFSEIGDNYQAVKNAVVRKSKDLDLPLRKS